MTKRARYIEMFVDELVDLVSNALFVRKNAFKSKSDNEDDVKRHKEAKEYLEKKQMKLKACMAEICENNEEQAEGLLHDLGVKWKKEVKPEDKSEDQS